MKNLILIIATLLSFSATTFASNIEDGSLSVLSSEKITLSLDNANQAGLILSSEFNVASDDVAMVFNTSVSMVQIFNNNGDLEMMFPVGSNELNLGLSLFTPGQYRVGFMVEGQETVQFTNLVVK